MKHWTHQIDSQPLWTEQRNDCGKNIAENNVPGFAPAPGFLQLNSVLTLQKSFEWA